MHLLNLAPHCALPPRDGADRRAWSLYEALLHLGHTGTFVGRAMSVGELGERHFHKPVSTWRNHKLSTAAASLLSGSDYWQMRMLGPGLRKSVADTAGKKFDAVIVHFLYNTALLSIFRGQRIRLVVDTHNYDPVLYGALGAAARNPLFRLLCRRAMRTSSRALQSLPSGTTMVHVSEADAEAYRKDSPQLHHVVVENGCSVVPRFAAPPSPQAEKKQLLFVASLSARMNQDALLNFETRFWPRLSDVADLTIAGSNPPAAFTARCIRSGWHVRPNVTEDDLTELYSKCHFAIAPFAYGAGSKLKLLEACGRGVPVLATGAATSGLHRLPPCLHLSDDPGQWRKIVVQLGPASPEDLQATLDFASRFAWPALGQRLARVLEEATLVNIR